MTHYARIEYPTCPECGILINNDTIFDLRDLTASRFFHKKECPVCEKPFLMKTRVELLTEVVAVEKE